MGRESPSAAGLFPAGEGAVRKVIERAAAEHVGLVSLARYRVRDVGPAGIVVGYGAVAQARWTPALEALVRSVRA